MEWDQPGSWKVMGAFVVIYTAEDTVLGRVHRLYILGYFLRKITEKLEAKIRYKAVVGDLRLMSSFLCSSLSPGN